MTGQGPTVRVPQKVFDQLVAVAAHVSYGKSAAFSQGPYPDATARVALGALDEAGLMHGYRRRLNAPHVAAELAAIIANADNVLKRQGRQALGDELLREVAVLYLAETAPGKPSGAVKRMADQYGRPVETIRTWLSRARAAGWLGPSGRGRTGAEPGPRLTAPDGEESPC